ncbi:MAG: hypothetical protein OFPI_44810 [Osedax symbiont Rs2]|nr:MAG: hypothetical protein OFPI_44810 [Osedax symbiont Rs2]
MSTQSPIAISADSFISTEQLMQGKNELVILHSDQRYLLRITRNGKLILTK